MVFLNEIFGGKFPISWSLGIISFIIFASIAYSIMVDKRSTRQAQAG
jgi:tellurite resistance protein TerC